MGRLLSGAWLKIRKFAGQKQSGMGVIEIILIIVGIFTPYYGVGIRCMA